VEYTNKTAISFVTRTNETDYLTIESSRMLTVFGGGVSGGNSSRRWGWVLPHLPMIPGSPIPDIPFPLYLPVFPAYGKEGGQQFLWMDIGSRGKPHETPRKPSPRQTGVCLHEIGHAIGLYHEHQRGDRYSYAWPKDDIDDPGINYTFNYAIFRGPYDLSVGDYDCRSIMNYYNGQLTPMLCERETEGKFHPDGKPVRFTFRWNEDAKKSQDTLSKGDIAAISFLYPTKTWSVEKWGLEWRATKPFHTKASNPLTLWYQASSGAVAISTLKAGGERVLFSGFWEKGLSFVASYEAQGKSYVLSFNSSTDMLNIFEVASSVNGPRLVKRTSAELAKFSPSHIEPFLIHGYPHLLVYSNKTGAAGILRIGDGGKSVRTEWTSPVAWDKDWTHFNIYSRTTKTPRLLAYKASTGRLSYTKIEYQSIEITWDNSVAIRFSQKKNPFVNFASKGGALPFPATLSREERVRKRLLANQDLGFQPNNPGWKSIATYQYDGSQYLCLLRDEKGATFAQFWRLTDSPSKPWILIGETFWDSPNWDTFFPYAAEDRNGNDELYFLLYKPDKSGDAAFGKVFVR
jgi:hypothetical protein